jgi:hypothetical protein
MIRTAIATRMIVNTIRPRDMNSSPKQSAVTGKLERENEILLNCTVKIG